MTDIIVGQKQFPVKIRLEIRLIEAARRFVAFIFIGKQHKLLFSALFFFFQTIRHLPERIRSQQIVVIQQTDRVSRRKFNSCVRIGGNSFVLGKGAEHDALILPFCKI